MIVNVLECFPGVERAKGTVVIVDVFRSCTVGCFVLDGGVADYYAVDSLEQARQLAASKNGKVLGELEGVPVSEFDYNNSPSLLLGSDISGQTLVHITNAGTRGLVMCPQAEELLVGSFVNAGAIIKYLREKKPDVVTLVAIGTNGVMRAQEDMMCCMYIKNELEDYPNSFKTLKSFLANVDSSEKFFDESREDAPEEDFDLCMDLDRFDFVIKGESVPEGVRLTRV